MKTPTTVTFNADALLSQLTTRASGSKENPAEIQKQADLLLKIAHECKTKQGFALIPCSRLQSEGFPKSSYKHAAFWKGSKHKGQKIASAAKVTCSLIKINDFEDGLILKVTFEVKEKKAEK